MKEEERKTRNQERLKQCYGPFAQGVRLVLNDLEEKGIRPRIQDAWRSIEEQLEAYNKGNSKVDFGFHNVTGDNDEPEALAVDILDDDAPLAPSRKYLLQLAATARKYGLETGILWSLPENLRKAVNQAIGAGDFEVPVKIGWDPTHVQPMGISIAQAREGLRPDFGPATPRPATATTPTGEPELPYVVYQVKSGETLGEIAQKFYDDPNEFDAIPLRPDIRLMGDQSLQIPKAGTSCADVVQPISEGTIQEHTVEEGDTLSKIAEKYYHDPDMYGIIAKFNALNDPDLIRIGQVLKIPPLHGGTIPTTSAVPAGTIAAGGEEVGGLSSFHSYKDGIRWALTKDGVAIEGEGVKGTPGNPITVTRIWEDYSGPINEWAINLKVPCVLIIATIATESGGKPRAFRPESGGRASMGLMQTLIGTARDILQDNSIDAEWLAEPRNSIQAGTAYIAGQRRHTNLDPPKVAAAYNAGSVRYDDNNRWKMHQNISDRGEPHCDRFLAFFNDAVQVLKNHATKPAIAYEGFYGST